MSNIWHTCQMLCLYCDKYSGAYVCHASVYPFGYIMYVGKTVILRIGSYRRTLVVVYHIIISAAVVIYLHSDFFFLFFLSFLVFCVVLARYTTTYKL